MDAATMPAIQVSDDAVAQTVMLFSFVCCVEAVCFVDDGYLLPFVNADDVGVYAARAEGFRVTFCHDAVFCPFVGAGGAPKVILRHRQSRLLRVRGLRLVQHVPRGRFW